MGTPPYESFLAGRGKSKGSRMSAYELFVLAVAGANGGMVYWAMRRRQQVFAWIKARRR